VQSLFISLSLSLGERHSKKERKRQIEIKRDAERTREKFCSLSFTRTCVSPFLCLSVSLSWLWETENSQEMHCVFVSHPYAHKPFLLSLCLCIAAVRDVYSTCVSLLSFSPFFSLSLAHTRGGLRRYGATHFFGGVLRPLHFCVAPVEVSHSQSLSSNIGVGDGSERGGSSVCD